MKQYRDLCQHIVDNAPPKEDRTGTGTISSFGHQMRFNLQEGFPLVTSKFTAFRLVASELLWFLRGETNIKSLLEDNNHIWDEWATEDGELGPVYGYQWRHWKPSNNIQIEGAGLNAHYEDLGIDQIAGLIQDIKERPHSRRHIVSAWNVADLPDETKKPWENAANGKMALAPCHVLMQFFVNEGKLSCQMYQRSADMFLGVPFNIASYALLTHMIAQVCDLEVGDYIHTFGDAHIYNNHFDQVDQMLKNETHPLPTLKLNPEVKDIFDFTMDDIEIVDYQHSGSIKAPVAV